MDTLKSQLIFSMTIMVKKHQWLIIYMLLVGLIWLAEAAIIGLRSLSPQPVYSSLDFSWMTDMLVRAQHGYLAGRDFIFTYGPLYQLLYAWPTALWGVSVMTVIQFMPLFSVILYALLIYSTLYLLGYRHQWLVLHSFAWLTLLGIVAIPTAGALKFLPVVFWAALLSRSLDLFRDWQWRRLITLALIPSLLGLYTYDLFMYAFIITILWSVIAVGRYGLRFSLRPTWLLLCTVGWQIWFSIMLSGNLSYVRGSLDTIQHYQYLMSIPWTFPNKMLFFTLPWLIGLFTWYWFRGEMKQKWVMLLLTLTSLLYWKSVITRADYAHLILGVYPGLMTIYLMSVPLIKRSIVGWLSLGVIYLLVPFVVNYSHLVPTSIRHLPAVINSKKKFDQVFHIVPSAYTFPVADIAKINNYLDQYPGEVMIYPYDNYLLNAQEQTYNHYVLQWYQTSHTYVERRAVADLSARPPKFVVFALDNLSTAPVDNIPNSSRNPLFMQWLRQHYVVAEMTPTMAILEYFPNKQWQTTTECLVWEISAPVDNGVIDKLITFIKPPIYMLQMGDYLIRAPLYPPVRNFYLYVNVDKPDGLQKLLTYQTVQPPEIVPNDSVTITKMWPLTGKIKQYTFPYDFSVRCQP